jgi:hypothetical protein
MQRNTSVSSTGPTAADVAAGGRAFYPVSESQFCTTKEGAAVKCAMAFRGSDLTAALVAGQPLYLGFEATQLTQVCCPAS